jgi:hypothetical protein
LLAHGTYLSAENAEAGHFLNCKDAKSAKFTPFSRSRRWAFCFCHEAHEGHEAGHVLHRKAAKGAEAEHFFEPQSAQSFLFATKDTKGTKPGLLEHKH